MKQYAKYKPSGFDWLGEIPEHWGLKRVKDVFLSIGSGSTPKSSMTELYDENGYYWVQSGDLNDGYVSDTKTKINDVALERTPALRLYPKDSLIVAMYGATIGKLGILTMDSYTNQACCVMSNPVQFNPLFLFYELCFFKPTMLSFATGGGQPNISQEDVKYHIFPYPPYPEQTAIVKYLDEKTANIDRRIELLKQKIDKYKELRRSLISQVVTRGLNPNVKFKDSGIDWLGQIPEHWETKRIKDLFRSDKGLSITKEDLVEKGLPVISYGQIHAKINNGTTIVDELIRYVPESFKEGNEKSLAHKGNFLFADTSEDTEGCGNCVYVDRETAVYAGYHTLLLRPISELANNKYIAFLFKSDEWRKQIRSVVNGVKLFSVTLKILNFRGVVLPPKDEQDDIAKYLDEKTLQIDTIVKKCEEQIEQLTALRRSLIAEVVTGKIKVTNE